jgi:hypothetical protein
MPLADFHGQLSNAVLLYTTFLGIWGIVNFVRGHNVSEGFWGALIIAELLILTQGSLGGILWAQGNRPGRWVHVLYGAVTGLGIPAVYIYTRGREGRGENLAYGSAALLVALLAIRAIVTA